MSRDRRHWLSDHCVALTFHVAVSLEDRSLLNVEVSRSQVAVHDRWSTDLDRARRDDVAREGAFHDQAGRRDLGLHFGGWAQVERAVGSNFSGEHAIDSHPSLERQLAIEGRSLAEDAGFVLVGPSVHHVRKSEG